MQNVKRIGRVLMLGVVVGLCAAGMAMGQDQPRGERAPGDRGPGGAGGPPSFDPETIKQRMEEGQKRMMDAMRERLGASAEEWKEIEPRLKKVMTLQMRSRMDGGMGGMMGFGGRGSGGFRGGDRGPGGGDRGAGGGDRGPGAAGGPGGGPGGPPGGFDRERMQQMMQQVFGDPSPASVKSRELRDLLEGDASAEAINKAMTALRAARKQQAQELDKARNDLKELLTIKQEAQLLSMGVLE
jgi:hypothetical protein